MRHRVPVIAAVVALVWAAVAPAASQSTAACSGPGECRDLALEARARGAYETFHDLAWRAVQSGRANDPELMYLLARAQALSGRRRDALIMLRRLAEAGAAGDAASEDDFRRVRELPGWGDVAALIQRRTRVAAAPEPTPPLRPPASAPAPAPSPEPRVTESAAAPSAAVPPAPAPSVSVAPPPVPTAMSPAPVPAGAEVEPPAVAPAAAAPEANAVRSALRIEPAAVAEAARFGAPPFAAAGFAHDAVSRRFLFGDAAGRRLFVVGEGSDRSIDLARAESAGFEQISAFAIDPRRGNLWVAGAGPEGKGGTLHRLQLISGREMARIQVPAESGSLRLSDVVVASDGSVLLLDSAAPRVLLLRPNAKSLETIVSLPVLAPASIAVTDGGIAYVAYQDGLLRLDLKARASRPVLASGGIALGSFEWLRWHRNALIGLQRQPDGSRGIVRLRVDRAGRTVHEAVLIDTPPAGASAAATISADDLYYVVATPTVSTAANAGALNIIVRRIRLTAAP